MILKIINDTKIKIKKLTLPFSMSSMMDAHNSEKTFILVIIAQFETISKLDISYALFDKCMNNICGWHQTYIL
jgi:hypothetical protein